MASSKAKWSYLAQEHELRLTLVEGLPQIRSRGDQSREIGLEGLSSAGKAVGFHSWVGATRGSLRTPLVMLTL
jgi:hypothetical protein